MTNAEPQPESDALSPLARSVFVDELRQQAGYVEIARADLAEMLRHNVRDRKRFWFTVSAMLGSISRFSNILWPASSGGPGKRRARQLRSELGLNTKSLLQQKDARNSVEHFAERIDKFVAANDSGSYVYMD